MKKEVVLKYKPKSDLLKHLLDDSVLDDVTRKSLMKDVLDHRRPQHGGQSHQAVQATAGHAIPSVVGGAPTAPPPSAPRRSSEATNSADSGELLTVMAQRLRTLESQVVVLHKELREKSLKATEFEDKHRAERVERKRLEEENAGLRTQLQEMHQFLADYGLSWVGNEGQSPPSSGGTPRSASSLRPFDLYDGKFNAAATEVGQPSMDAGSAPPQQPRGPLTNASGALPFDLDLLKKNADILSSHVGLQGLMPGQQSNTRVLKERDMVYVAVYSDGICVNSGPFRPYGWPLCDAVIDDMIEGFYPYEFREKYPDGFPITVVDHSTEACPLKSAAAKPANGVHGLQDVSDHGYKPLTRDAFLKRLPEKYVTSAGQLVSIRQGVAAVLSGGTAHPGPTATVAPETSASRELNAPPSCDTGAPGSSITALQIKLPEGTKVVLHMYFHDTILQVRQELEKAVPSFRPAKGYEFATVFPRQTYSDHAQTLEQAGLVPNCTLMIKLAT